MIKQDYGLCEVKQFDLMRLPVRLDLIKCLMLEFCDICLQFIQYYPRPMLQSAKCLGVKRNSVLRVFSLSCLSACWTL